MSQESGPGWPPILTPALAQGIAGDTSAIIGFNVLITGRDATVIGSGDTSRIGSFHEASVQVMRTLQPAAHSAAQARRLCGVRPGITLPIIIEGSALGTVGITGSPTQVQRFGLVVKRQTEILLQESMLLRTRMLRERTVEDLIRDIAHFAADRTEPEDVIFRARELGYDLRAPRVVVLIEVSPTGSPTGRPVRTDDPPLRSTLLRIIRETFSESHDIVAAMASTRFAVLHRVSTRDTATPEPTALRLLIGAIEQRLALPARVGIGGVATSVPQLRDSYEDAEAALRLGPCSGAESSIHSIDELRVHQLLADAPDRARSRFVGVFVAELRLRPDWPLLRQTIITWSESGFNLVRAAAALNIHRNTLVYRLDKIAQITGRPTSRHAAWLALYLACVADQLDH
jgi:carbohydrate diacid regulator